MKSVRNKVSKLIDYVVRRPDGDVQIDSQCMCVVEFNGEEGRRKVIGRSPRIIMKSSEGSVIQLKPLTERQPPVTFRAEIPMHDVVRVRSINIG